MSNALTLDEIELEIELVVDKSATERAETAARLNAALKQQPRTTRRQRLRACVLTCLLRIPSGGTLRIPECTRHAHD